MEREVMWLSLDEKIYEHLRLSQTKDGVVADGLGLRLNESGSLRLRYRIQCDNAWQVRSVVITNLDASNEELVLNSDGEGNWSNGAGDPLPDLKGCRDVDIFYSPFTNTLAIRRLALQMGESEEIKVAFITVPGLQVSAVLQRYTLLESHADHALYRYEGLSSGFVTELPVDLDGLVIEYPKFFKRRWAK